MTQPENAEVRVITTGGTIDKTYDPLKGELVIGVPSVIRAFAAASVSRESEPLKALAKDSLEISEAERLLLANVVAAAASQGVLVTHGTDTMSETAAMIDGLCPEKTVVITGAMVPSGFPGSDAEFNIGFAYAAAQLLPPGVYIAMHGKVVHHTKYRKDRSVGRFVEN